MENRNTTSKLGSSLQKLLLVVARGRLFHLSIDLFETIANGLLATGTLDDRRPILGDSYFLCLPEEAVIDLVETDSKIFRNKLPAGQDRHVFHESLAPVAKTGRLHGNDLQNSLKLVDHESSKEITLYVFRNDDERLSRPSNAFEHRHKLLQVTQLLLIKENVRILVLGDHLGRIRDEVRRDIALVELQPLDDLEVSIHTLALFESDHTVVTNALESLGEQLANQGIMVRGDLAHLTDSVEIFDLDGLIANRGDHFIHSLPHTTLNRERIDASADELSSFAHHRFGQNHCCGRSVANLVISAGRDFVDDLGTHVFERVGQLDLSRDRNAVLRTTRVTELLVDNHVLSRRSQSGLDRSG